MNEVPEFGLAANPQMKINDIKHKKLILYDEFNEEIPKLGKDIKEELEMFFEKLEILYEDNIEIIDK